MSILSGLLPGLLMIVGFVPLVAMKSWREYRQRKQGRRSPLTKKMLRPPGYSARRKIQTINEDLAGWVAVVFGMPFVAFSGFMSLRYIGGDPNVVVGGVTVVVSAVAGMAFATFKINGLLNTRSDWELGMEGEMFTGQELDQLMRHGCRVFHDIEMDNGSNIDHVVVSRSGVYCVETKAWRKSGEADDADATVDDTKKIIVLPDGRVKCIPLKQLNEQNDWLSKHLSRGLQESVKIESVLALPGYNVKRPKHAEVFVFNPHEVPSSFFVKNWERHDQKQVGMIARQLEMLCRDVEPSQQKEREAATR